MNKRGTFLVTSLCAALLSACGGGGGDGDGDGDGDGGTSSRTVSGVVADGYLKGVTVCLDVNQNANCDPDEPTSAVTGSDGTYTIPDVPSDIADNAPVVAIVPASAQDSDDTITDPTATLGRGYVLMAPAGRSDFVSPLSTLVQAGLLDNPALSANESADAIKADVGSLSTADLFANYITSGEVTVHEAAKVIANSFSANHDMTKDYLTGDDNKELMVVLSKVAKKALQSQGGIADASLPVGNEDANTLLAAVADEAGAAAATQDVIVNFDVKHAGSSVRCGDPINLDNTQLWDPATDTLLTTPVARSTSGSLVDLRFYVSNVLLWDAAGNAVPLLMTENANQSENLALMDFGYNTDTLPAITCTTAYHTAISGKVAPGTYTGISMTIGVPIQAADLETKLNHVNAADVTSPAPLQVTSMQWTWQSGRKFSKIEFHPDSNVIEKIGATTSNRWNVHIGSTGCAGDPTLAGTETACTNPNRLSLMFDTFDTTAQTVVLDVGALFQNADMEFDGGGAGGCMSGATDPECVPIFEALGLSQVDGLPTGTQSVFSVE
ncbi:MAG: metallo-mystery pair system four-Cys motif protein [Candidatus Thiodiazotropha sp.]